MLVRKYAFPPRLASYNLRFITTDSKDPARYSISVQHSAGLHCMLPLLVLYACCALKALINSQYSALRGTATSTAVAVVLVLVQLAAFAASLNRSMSRPTIFNHCRWFSILAQREPTLLVPALVNTLIPALVGALTNHQLG